MTRSHLALLNPLTRPVWQGTPPVNRLVVLLATLAIIGSGLLGWGLVRLGGAVVAPAQVRVVDQRGHRPQRPPLPVSPFVRP